MDDAMRERALDSIGCLMCDCDAIPSGVHPKWHCNTQRVRITRSELLTLMLSFAASEADRREHECIEAACYDCEMGETPDRVAPRIGAPYWHHDGGRNEPAHCWSSAIHELRYQREQREKGEWNGRG